MAMLFVLDTGPSDMHSACMEVPDNKFFDLRQQAGYWRAQHALAAKRTSGWKGKAKEFEGMVKALKASLAESAKEKEGLKARIAWLERQVFGAKGEQSKENGAGSDEDAPLDGASLNQGAPRGARKRGQQRGKKALDVSLTRNCLPKRFSMISLNSSGVVRTAHCRSMFFQAPRTARISTGKCA